MSDRVILHCDMNSFFCSVELLDHPELADKPVAVAGTEDKRHGIVLAKNQIAKRMGVNTPDPVIVALRKCPDLIFLEPHFDKYKHFYHVINDIYLQYTDMVEPFSIDESWLDVTGSLKLFKKTGKELADEIRERVYKETGLTQSIGVSFNKTFAKMGSDYKKPYATTEITRENFKDLLWPLPAGELFFVGKSSAEKLATYNIKTIGDIATADDTVLSTILGRHGLDMKKTANGVDDEPVRVFGDYDESKSVGHGITFKRNVKGEADIRVAVTAICDKVASNLRRYGYMCKGVKLEIKDPNFVVISRQMQLGYPTDLAKDLNDAVMELFKANWYFDNPIRLITITGINIVMADSKEEEEQISFFEETKPKYSEKQKSLESAMDGIRDKFGKSAIVSGNIIGNDLGIEMEDR